MFPLRQGEYTAQVVCPTTALVRDVGHFQWLGGLGLGVVHHVGKRVKEHVVRLANAKAVSRSVSVSTLAMAIFAASANRTAKRIDTTRSDSDHKSDSAGEWLPA